MKFDENVEIQTNQYKRIDIDKFENYANDVLDKSKTNAPGD